MGLSTANPPHHGAQVREAQKLLKHNRFGCFYHGRIDGEAGPLFVRAVRQAKFWCGYRKERINGIFGHTLEHYLEGGKLPADKAARRRMRRHKAAHDGIRARIVHEANWGIHHEPEIHYAQTRPIPYEQWGRHHLPIHTDCSGSITCIFKKAGAPDPNGNGYDGTGYTGDMLRHLHRIPRSELQHGDLVCFGEFPGHHVCLVLQGGPDPLLFSHGQERGPFAIRLSAEQRFQGAAPIFLSAGV